MKFKVLFIAGLLCAIIVQSCKKENLAVVSKEQEEVSNVKAALIKLGFDTATAIIKGEDIFVEEDILLKRSELFKTQPRQAVIRPNSIGALGYLLRSFTYFIATSLTHHKDVLNGISEIRNVMPNRVAMTRVYTEAGADLVFRGYNESSTICGFASWPTINWSLPINELIVGESVNINLFQWQNLNSSQRRALIAHEIGHAIGIRHTNWRQYGEGEFFSITNGDGSPITYGAYTVPNTNNTSLNPDPSSIFNGNSCGRSWGSGLTVGDRLAIRYVSTNIFNP